MPSAILMKFLDSSFDGRCKETIFIGKIFAQEMTPSAESIGDSNSSSVTELLHLDW
jgi:hypothetical protein